MDMLNEEQEDTLTLGEVYAELLGPEGVIKNCLGQVRPPAIGGRMVLGPKGFLRVVVTGMVPGLPPDINGGSDVGSS